MYFYILLKHRIYFNYYYFIFIFLLNDQSQLLDLGEKLEDYREAKENKAFWIQ